uniref:Uncharacterized protein n=1 Tax=Rhizophora mucronata TaxID=61149 RepID=A0A2P2QDH5_RHIMU
MHSFYKMETYNKKLVLHLP